MERRIHTIDATDKILGRLATEIALLLRGKNKPNFVPYKEDMGDVVIVKNIDKIRVTGKKMKQKQYLHHSGYLGGLKKRPFKTLLKQNPAEIFKMAVLGMLPKNKLRAKIIKRLKFE
jgi:large subunit ribosomal protein L13